MTADARPRGAALVVFDLDGTLVDSRRDLAESANAVLAESGLPVHSEEAIGRMVGDGAATLVARAFAAAGSSPPPDALARFLDVYNARLLRFTRPYPGVPDTLDALARRAVLAVLTNKPLAATVTILEGLDLARFFTGGVLGGDGPLPRKPDPAGLRELLDRASANPEEALMVGDSIIDWQTARAAGVPCALAGYGFGFEGFPVDRLTEADRVVLRPEDVLTLV